MRISEIVDFNGERYYRYPDSPRASHRAYFQGPGGSLHRAIWVAANGPVPDAHEIHHRDGDTLNNDLANLECVPISAHRAESQGRRRARTYECFFCGASFESRSGTRYARRFCSQGCENRQRNQDEVDHGEIVCAWCGKTHRTKNFRTVRYCSSSCYMLERHAQRKT